MNYQSYRQCFVSNTGTLLANGSTVDLIAPGMVGIIDASTNLAVTAPTYATTKAFKFVWGTPDINTGLWGGVPNENEYTKLIKGKNITGFRAKKASKPQTQKIVIGWSGDAADTASMTASCGDVKFLYLNLTGTAIDKLFSKQGLVRQYAVDTSCWCDNTDCAPNCQGVDPCRLATEFATQIQNDVIAGIKLKNLIKATTITECSLGTPVSVYTYRVTVCDDGSDAAQSIVQAQYHSDLVTRVSRIGSNSTYSITKNALSTPTAVSNAGIVTIPNCTVCPTGYTKRTGYVTLVQFEDAGNATALATMTSNFGIGGTSTISRINYEFGVSTYVIVTQAPFVATSAGAAQNEIQTLTSTGGTSGTFTITFNGITTGSIAYNANAATVNAALDAAFGASQIVAANGSTVNAANTTFTFSGSNYQYQNVPLITFTGSAAAAGTFSISTTQDSRLLNTMLATLVGGGFTSLGAVRDVCVVNSATTTAWSLYATQSKYPKTFRLTIADSVCGTNRLTDIQAALDAQYGAGVVTASIVNSSGSCVHTYTVDVYSQPVDSGCSVDVLNHVRPANFEGVKWELYSSTTVDTTKRAGIQIEVAFVNRVTNECTFDAFPAYEYDTVAVSATEFNPDWNSSNCASTWKVRQIQAFKPPIGNGGYVREQEMRSKGYDLRERSYNAVVRDIEGYSFQADPNIYYDEYVLEFNHIYKVGGWSEREVDSYHVSFFFPEGNGKTFETAINTYLASSAIQIAPVVL